VFLLLQNQNSYYVRHNVILLVAPNLGTYPDALALRLFSCSKHELVGVKNGRFNQQCGDLREPQKDLEGS